MEPTSGKGSLIRASASSRASWRHIVAATPLFAVPGHQSPLITIARWVARFLALGLLFLWGAFFVEHFSQWILQPPDWPPPRVLVSLSLHLGFLLGLIVGWRWELFGASLVFLFAGAFFSSIALMGGNPRTMAAFFVATCLPAILWLTLSLFHAQKPMG